MVFTKVAIVGIGQTNYEEKMEAQFLDELVFEGASKALEDAGIAREEVDNVVIAASDQIDGRAISSMVLACPAGAYMKDEIKVSDEGSYAVLLACLRILSGVFQTSLVVSWTKCSEVPVESVTNLSLDPFFHRAFGMNHISAMALQANSYTSKYKVPEGSAAKIVVKNRSNALHNSYAHLRRSVTTAEVLQSKIVSWPIREMELPPKSDGACALVLVAAEKAKSMVKKPVWVNGIGWATDTYYLGERELWKLSSLEIAARQAYKMAGIKEPLVDLDVAEIYDASAYHEMMAYEALGFCEPGNGHRLIEDGVTEMTGKLPVNASGGVLSSNPYFASGLVRVAEAALQVRGEAQERQVSGAKLALAHGSYGFCGQGNSVFILGSEG